jgi:hypothetical protein
VAISLELSGTWMQAGNVTVKVGGNQQGKELAQSFFYNSMSSKG